ncbi:MAG: hypothetical protein WC307_00180 [Candidatus Nanoarchaeia archaeon]|jgi:hypothetical protein
MAIIGVSLREINLKREDIIGSINIKNVKNNINIVDIKTIDTPLGESGKALVFTFEFNCDYEMSKPKEGLFGKIFFVGDVIFTEKKAVLDSAVKSWKKNKKVDDDVLLPVLQAALNNVTVEAIYLSRKVMLPSPVQLPKITKDQ